MKASRPEVDWFRLPQSKSMTNLDRNLNLRLTTIPRPFLASHHPAGRRVRARDRIKLPGFEVGLPALIAPLRCCFRAAEATLFRAILRSKPTSCALI